MSKSITNQRYIFKINSGRFIRNIKEKTWILNSTIEDGKRNEEIVPLGDSTLLRIFRSMKNYTTSEKEIRNLKEQIKKLKKDKNAKENREKIIELRNKISDLTFVNEIISIVFESTKDWDFAKSKKTKVIFNNEEYVRLVGTNGGVKKNTVIFVKKTLHEQIDKKMNNGRNEKKKYIPAKFESYKALTCSASTPVTQPKGVLVINDGETIINETVIRLFDKEGDINAFNKKKVDDYEIKRAFTDGCGMISEKLSKQWVKDLELVNEDGEALYTATGFNIRNSWCKGMVFTFPYLEFAKDIAKSYMVKDAWGDERDIRNVELIITTNMLKLWDAYDSLDDYLENCEENGYGFSVAKVLPNRLESVRNMNYQFLQSYNFTDEDIEELIEPTVKSIKGALSEDYVKTLLFLKGCKINPEDFKDEKYDYVKALMIDKRMMNDPFVKSRIRMMINKRINDSKKGVLQVNGNYSVISGDLYALCQHMYGMEVTGLLKKDEFYSRTWSNKKVDKIVAFRAPMTVHNNIRILNLVDNAEVRKWYRFMKTCTIFNAWDTAMDALNGCDMDWITVPYDRNIISKYGEPRNLGCISNA